MSGHLFKNTERISATDAVRVQNEIIDKIHFKYPHLKIIKIGSVGKKSHNESHGDIDLAIVCEDFKELCSVVNDVFVDAQKKTLDSKTLYVHSVSYLYVSDIDNQQKYVQVDFMISNNEEYTKFRYHCPDYSKNESKYKVYGRILLINTILNNIDESKYNLSPLCLIIKKQDSLFSNIEKTDDVDEIIHIAFDDTVSVSDFNSVESIWKILHSDSFKYKDKLSEIEKKFFISAYNQPWEELNINPEDFDITYHTAEELRKEMHKFDFINNLNMKLIAAQKI